MSAEDEFNSLLNSKSFKKSLEKSEKQLPSAQDIVPPDSPTQKKKNEDYRKIPITNHGKIVVSNRKKYFLITLFNFLYRAVQTYSGNVFSTC